MTASGVPLAGQIPVRPLGTQPTEVNVGQRLRGNRAGGVQKLRDAWRCRAGRRRALARQLRQTAACSAPPSRFDRLTVPVLLNRVSGMRAEMITLASALEHTEDASPVTVAIVDRLLHDGTSPLYDERAPELQLASALAAAQRSLTASPEDLAAEQ